MGRLASLQRRQRSAGSAHLRNISHRNTRRERCPPHQPWPGPPNPESNLPQHRADQALVQAPRQSYRPGHTASYGALKRRCILTGEVSPRRGNARRHRDRNPHPRNRGHDRGLVPEPKQSALGRGGDVPGTAFPQLPAAGRSATPHRAADDPNAGYC